MGECCRWLGSLKLPGTESTPHAYENHRFSSHRDPNFAPDQIAIADALGRYRIEVPHHSSILAVAPNMAALDFLRVDEPNQTLDGLDLELHPSVRVHGNVIAAGHRVDDAQVHAEHPRGWTLRRASKHPACSYQPIPPQEWATNAKGQFAGELPSTTSWGFRAIEGGRYGNAFVETLSADPITITIAQPEVKSGQFRVFGFVVDPRGQRIPYASLHMDDAGKTKANEHGEWEFMLDARDEPSRLMTTAADSNIRILKLEPILNDTGPIVVQLDPGSSLKGVLVDSEGKPLANKIIRVEGDPVLEGNTVPPNTVLSVFGRKGATTDDAGQFEFSGLSREEYRLVYNDETELAITTVRAPAAGIRLVVGEVHGSEVRIQGLISDQVTGKPIANASVSAMRRAPSIAGEMYYGSRNTRSDSRGHFDLRGMPEDTIQLSASADGYASAGLSNAAYKYGDHKVSIDLFPVRSLHLRVLDPAGMPVSQASVHASDPTGKNLSIRTASGSSGSPVYTSSTGEVHLHDLPARRITLRIRSSA